jgi:hypothetical protein
VETGDYIRHRLRVAGGGERAFSDEAIDLVWKESEGVPRRINTLSDLAMVYGFAGRQEVVTERVVREMLEDRRGLAIQTDTSMSDPARAARTSPARSSLQVVSEAPRG